MTYCFKGLILPKYRRGKNRIWVIDSKHKIQLTIYIQLFRLNHKISEEKNLSLEASWAANTSSQCSQRGGDREGCGANYHRVRFHAELLDDAPNICKQYTTTHKTQSPLGKYLLCTDKHSSTIIMTMGNNFEPIIPSYYLSI